MSDRLRIGIVGCGGISPSHIRIYAEHLSEEAEIVAVCDIDEAKARSRSTVVRDTYAKRAEELETRAAQTDTTAAYERRNRQIEACRASAREAAVFTDYEKMIAEADIDAINICVPPFAHSGPAIAAAQAGKHVFCEGPISGSLSEADAMIAAAKAPGVVFTVQYGHTRFHRTAMMAKRAIENGDLGRIIMGNVDVLWHRGQDYYDMDAWRGTWKGERGGATYHHGRYAIDLYLWLMGAADEVYARMGTFTHDIEVEDTSVALLTFAGGAFGQITASTSAHPNPKMPSQRIEIFGERASIAVIPEYAIGSAEKGYAEALAAKLERETPAVGTEGMPGQFVDFIRAIRTGSQLFISGASTRPQLEVTKAIYKSVETGAAVRLPIQRYDPYYTL
ncbi:Gfo/Idh/MocA family oxidoreductase [Candidatus Poribacteria bacterium]|nr:Gfo/Idh/MocA family oxidoreductase [Candidatus Poribacteria bacterium]